MANLKPIEKLLAEGTVNEKSAAELVRAYVLELAETVGKRYGVRHGEEFNHLGRSGSIPEHILERAKPGR